MNNKPSTLPQFAATIGIDWADEKHDVSLRTAGGPRSEHRVLEQTPESVHEWVAELRRQFQNKPVAIAVETSRGPLVAALQHYDFIFLFPVNPAMLASYRQAFRVSGAKDDPTDAMLLEQIVRLHADQLRPLRPDTELTRKLAACTEIRRHLVDERTRLVNELHSLVKTYFPLIESLFEDFTLPLVSSFLLKWPDLTTLQDTAQAALRKFFFAHNCRRTKTIDERLELIKKARALTTDLALIEPAAMKAQALAAMLQPLHKAIAKFEAQIQKAMDVHPDAAIFRSFPGAGPALAPRLLVAFGTDRSRFQSAAEVQQLYGIAPVKKQSGKTHLIHMRFRCPKFGRQTFHENATHALKQGGWTKEFYDQQRTKNRGHHAAVRSLSFKLIRIYFRCWQNRKSYDEGLYETALKQHGSTLLAAKN